MGSIIQPFGFNDIAAQFLILAPNKTSDSRLEAFRAIKLMIWTFSFISSKLSLISAKNSHKDFILKLYTLLTASMDSQ